jgi:hypothetical protein
VRVPCRAHGLGLARTVHYERCFLDGRRLHRGLDRADCGFGLVQVIREASAAGVVDVRRHQVYR